MTEQLSRERLEALANLQSLECMALPASHAESAQMARMLLAGLDSEPVAWTSQRSLDVRDKIVAFTSKESADEYGSKSAWTDIAPLYAAPPAPVAVPDEAAVGEMSFLGSGEASYVRGWNDCRAAMLKGDKS